MKKTILTLAVATFTVGTILSSCQSQADKIKDAEKKVQDAQNKVTEAKLNLDQALKDSIQQFKKTSEEQIAANEKSIADFKAKLEKNKKANRVQYEKRLAELEQQNREMRKRLDDFREDGKENWVSFRNKFNHDMEQMGKSFHDFWTGNK
jgi:DNA repair exonuclease SbcCD ATPase subunit